jgi:cephalosporin-C deacetylase
MDAVRAIDVAATLPEVDPERIVTFGGSQGGALSIVASALSGHSQKCYSGITSYCCLQERVEKGSGILNGVTEYLRKYPWETDKAMETLSYFDVINMVSLLKVPVLFCMGLADPICLPQFVYSAYAHVPGEKAVDMYPFVEHKMPREWIWKVHGEFAKL